MSDKDGGYAEQGGPAEQGGSGTNLGVVPQVARRVEKLEAKLRALRSEVNTLRGEKDMLASSLEVSKAKVIDLEARQMEALASLDKIQEYVSLLTTSK